MSTQINQYLMYAISVPPNEFKDRGWEWINDMGDKFQKDSSYKKEVEHVDGIFWLEDGMSGGYSLIGKVLEKTSDGNFLGADKPMKIPVISSKEKTEIRRSVLRNFNIGGDFQIYLITHYR